MDLRATAVAIFLFLCLIVPAALTPHPDTGRGPLVVHSHIVAAPFKIGQTVISQHKTVTGNPVWVTAERWTSVEAISIPAGGHYTVTAQVRLPRRAWAEFRLVRHGWGADPDGMDETGYHVFRARPDGRPTSESFTHALKGGGPIEFQLRLHLPAPHPVLPVALPTLICKAHRTD